MAITATAVGELMAFGVDGPLATLLLTADGSTAATIKGLVGLGLDPAIAGKVGGSTATAAWLQGMGIDAKLAEQLAYTA